MAKCPKCGAELAPAAKQCPSCGVGLAWQPVVPPPPPPPPPPPAPARPESPDKGKRQWLIACLVLVGCAVFGLPIPAAILFPVFARAREKARQVSCLANVRSVSIAMLAYLQDNDQRFPPRAGGVSAAPVRGSASSYSADDWRTQLLPYVNSREVFICPTRQQPDSYEFNEELYGVRLESVKRPERTLGVFDKGYRSGSPAPPHSGGYNVGFADGNCRWESGFEGRTARP